MPIVEAKLDPYVARDIRELSLDATFELKLAIRGESFDRSV